MPELDTLRSGAHWLVAHPLAAGAAALAAVAALAVIVLILARLARMAYRAGLARTGRAIAMPLVLAWEAQGLHALAVASGASGAGAYVLALTTSAVLVTLSAMADDHYRKHETLGWPGRLVWIVALPMGAMVAGTADTGSTQALRVILPLLVVIVWWARYAPVILAKARREAAGVWRWTPRRIGIALGLVIASDEDVEQVSAERTTARLTRLARGYHYGVGGPVRAWRGWRLDRLTESATPAVRADVVERVAAVVAFREETRPVGGRPSRAPRMRQSATGATDATATAPGCDSDATADATGQATPSATDATASDATGTATSVCRTTEGATDATGTATDATGDATRRTPVARQRRTTASDATGDSDSDTAAAGALRDILAARASGTRITGAELGRRYGRSPRWGQRLIADTVASGTTVS